MHAHRTAVDVCDRADVVAGGPAGVVCGPDVRLRAPRVHHQLVVVAQALRHHVDGEPQTVSQHDADGAADGEADLGPQHAHPRWRCNWSTE
jgi:hypothetical protein